MRDWNIMLHVMVTAVIICYPTKHCTDYQDRRCTNRKKNINRVSWKTAVHVSLWLAGQTTAVKYTLHSPCADYWVYGLSVYWYCVCWLSIHWLLDSWIICALIIGYVDYLYWLLGLWIIYVLIIGYVDYPCTHNWVCVLSMHWLLGLCIIHALLIWSVDYLCTDYWVCGLHRLLSLQIIHEHFFVIFKTCWRFCTFIKLHITIHTYEHCSNETLQWLCKGTEAIKNSEAGIPLTNQLMWPPLQRTTWSGR